MFDEENTVFPWLLFPATCLCSEKHEYARENEKTLRKLFSSHYHPLRLTSVLHLHHTFCSTYPSVILHTASLLTYFSHLFSLPHYSFSPLFTWESVEILRGLSAHTHCGSSVRVIMKCRGKEDYVEWCASSLQYKRSCVPKEGHMKRLSPQSSWLSRCHSQLACRESCCGPQEATVRGLTQPQAPAPVGSLAFHRLIPASLFCTARLRGA